MRLASSLLKRRFDGLGRAAGSVVLARQVQRYDILEARPRVCLHRGGRLGVGEVAAHVHRKAHLGVGLGRLVEQTRVVVRLDGKQTRIRQLTLRLAAQHAHVGEQHERVGLLTSFIARDARLKTEVVAAALVLVVVEGAERPHAHVTHPEGLLGMELAYIGESLQLLEHRACGQNTRLNVHLGCHTTLLQPCERRLEAFDLVGMAVRDKERLNLKRDEPRLCARVGKRRARDAAVDADEFFGSRQTHSGARPFVAASQHMQLKHSHDESLRSLGLGGRSLDETLVVEDALEGALAVFDVHAVVLAGQQCHHKGALGRNVACNRGAARAA